MLPNLSPLSIDVGTKHGRSAKDKMDMRVKKLIKRGERRNFYQSRYLRVHEKWKQAIGGHFGDDDDVLADGIAYRCENTLYDLFNGSYYDGLGRCLHMAWDEFHTFYGNTCAMFSTRALQNCGFRTMHGARWSPALLHIEEDNDPSAYHSDWLLDLWVKTRRGARDHSEWKNLRPEDQFKNPDEFTAKLLDRWEEGEWKFPQNDSIDWDDFWKTHNPKSKQEFAELSVEAVNSAPWWVLRNTPDDLDVELLEFSVSSPQEDRAKLIKIASCVLALVEQDDAGNERVVYSLPFEVKPGSNSAQEYASRILLRKYDRESRGD